MEEENINIDLEFIRATMAYEDMPLTSKEVDICHEVLIGELSADKVVNESIKNYRSSSKTYTNSFNKTYCYPDTDVLINLLDIRDFDQLKEAERKITSVRIAELKRKPIKGEMNNEYLKKIHKHIFKDIYQWAGDFRTVKISKGFMFAYPEHLESQGQELFNNLKKENLKGLIKENLVERLAYYKAEINVLHPFREGNGRTTREFMDVLAKKNEQYLHINETEKDEYLKAMIQSPYNTDLLKKLINDWLDSEKKI